MVVALKKIIGVDKRPRSYRLREDLLERLSPYLSSYFYKKGQDFELDKGEAGLYYLVEGRLEVHYKVDEGLKTVCCFVESGEFFSEIGFVEGSLPSGKVVVVEDSNLLYLSRLQIRKLRMEDPILFSELVLKVGKSLGQRYKQALATGLLNVYSAILSEGKKPIFKNIKQVPLEILQTGLWSQVMELVEQFKGIMFEVDSDIYNTEVQNIDDKYYLKIKVLIDSFDAYLEILSRQLGECEKFLKYMWGYIFKEIFPYFMRSRFAQRAYFKPKGYAGDFLMMEAIYRNIPDGDGPLGVLVDRYCLDTPPARAVRGRRRLLSRLIENFVRSRVSSPGQDKKVKIMNLACGSNRELFDFIRRFDKSHLLECICIDADPDALAYTDERVNNFPHDAKVVLKQENVIKWTLRRSQDEYGQLDLIYSAGLTDYLEDKLFIALVRKAWSKLKPGGQLILSNFSTSNPNKAWMDHILQWKLIHRSDEDLQRLFNKGGFNDVEIVQEEEGVNLFAIGVKSF